MRSSTKWIALCTAIIVTGLGSSVVRAQDPAAAIDARQAVMKAQGKAMAAIKAFIDDKGDLTAAQAAGADLLVQIAKIPDIFPKGTGMAEFPGKSYVKPAVWTEWDKFLEIQKTALAKAQALSAALKGGDKAAITAAFGDLGKNGCGACHEPYREKKPS
jgi:cytochrome c556